MRIAVAYNDDLALKPNLNEFERIGEAEVADAAREIAELLGAELVPVGANILAALDRLRAFDVVVNLCEGVLGNPAWEMHFALALEMLGIPFTGCDPTATAICTDKALVKKFLRNAGVNTPDATVVTSAGDIPALDGTWIVKPSRSDAGIGIDPGAVVTSHEDLAARCRYVLETYGQPALAERFIDGRELNQSFFLGRALPPGEVVFAEDLAPSERIVGWKAKWDAGSREDLGTANRTPAQIDDATRDALARLCSRAADVLGLGTGYCRFDVRQDRDGELYIVDINPHPDLGRDAGYRKALAAAGIGFRDFLDALIMSATHENPSRRAQGS